MIAMIGAFLFVIVVVMTVLVACGAPLGEFTMGGKYKVLPKQLRVMAIVSFFIQLFAIIIVLQAGGIVTLWFSEKVTKNICIFFAVYLSFNTIANLLSKSKKEKYFATPLSFAAAICFWITALTAYPVNTSYISIQQLPEDYTLENAKSDNCIVFENNDITSGQDLWNKFIASTENGKSATVRLAYYYTLGDPSHYSKEHFEEIKDDYPVLYINDLSYNGRKYLIQGMEDGQLFSKEYSYLMKYEGMPSIKTAVFSKYTYYVLVDDNTVTWDDIEYGLLSSKYGDMIDHYKVYSDLVMK